MRESADWPNPSFLRPQRQEWTTRGVLVIQLSHIGELLLAKMIHRSRPVQELLFRCIASPASAGGELVAVPEVQLGRSGKYRFDGAHKLDAAILLTEKGNCLGIEAKPGRDRLSKTEFEKRFLKDCGTSHSDSRISGSMIAILDGKLPNMCERGGGGVEYDNTDYRLLPEWIEGA